MSFTDEIWKRYLLLEKYLFYEKFAVALLHLTFYSEIPNTLVNILLLLCKKKTVGFGRMIFRNGEGLNHPFSIR